MIHRNAILTLLLWLIGCMMASAMVTLPRLISDGMVLQRDATVRIWGWADRGEKISVNFIDSIYETTANERGEWAVTLQNLKAGGPFQMTIIANNTLVINDILIGDVWLCSGQSNMEISMARVSPIYESEIANATNPYIRYFEVPKKYDFNTSQKDLPGGQWQSANQESILKFSAVAYFFASELYQKYKVPIGLINSSLGGSPVQTWISEDALKAFPQYYNEARMFKDSALIHRIESSDNYRINKWHETLRQFDAGYADPNEPWYAPGLDDSDWPTMQIPGYWADGPTGAVNGVVWFRKEFDVPESMTGEAVKLNLGRIVDADSVFVNGAFVGTTSYQYPPRRYEIPAGLLKAGRNSIVVRIINSAGNGGFVPDKPYELRLGSESVDLKGEWHCRIGAQMPPLESQTFIRWKPVGLFNAMISPLLNYRIKGAIWYQGESNTKKPDDYYALFSTLVKNWRDKWQQGDFPFLYVQLANFMEANDKPSESNWALVREAQLKALSLPNTGMAVTIDTGEWNDIHPLNKKTVGRRLALAARNIAYGEKYLVSSGPIFESAKIEENKMIISFSNTGDRLMGGGGKDLKGFAIAGEDQRFVWAKAKIEGTKVIVWSDEVPHPVAVRYGWADNPQDANLYNIKLLPASPFRTDDWSKPE